MQEKWKEALELMIDGYPALPGDPKTKGLVALCVVTEWPHETARKEIKGEYAKLGFDRAMQIMEACEKAGGDNCRALRDAIESTKPNAGHPTHAHSLTELLADANKEHADVFTAYAETLRSGGGLTDNAKRRLLKEALEAAAASLALVEGIEHEPTNIRRVV